MKEVFNKVWIKPFRNRKDRCGGGAVLRSKIPEQEKVYGGIGGKATKVLYNLHYCLNSQRINAKVVFILFKEKNNEY